MGVRRPPPVISAVSHLEGVSYPRIILHIDCLAQLVSQDTGIRQYRQYQHVSHVTALLSYQVNLPTLGRILQTLQILLFMAKYQIRIRTGGTLVLF